MYLRPIVCFTSLLFSFLSATEGKSLLRKCAVKKGDGTLISVVDELEQPLHTDSDGNNHQYCLKGFNSCYTLWKNVKLANNVSSMVIIAQGCWESGSCSKGDVCQADVSSTMKKNTLFCCCSSDLCNSNVSISNSKPLVQEPTVPPSPLTGSGGWEKSVVGGCMLGVATIAVLLAVFVARRLAPPSVAKPFNSHHAHRADHITNHSPINNYSLSLLTLDRIIGQGRYGTVWLGTVRGDEHVAVKMYPSHYCQYYYNEKDIYSLPFMKHHALLQYFGCDEYKTNEGLSSYAIVVSYCPLGTLQDYLRNNVLDLNNFSSMALSIAAGLAHLHTEIRKGDKWKPCISHRDVNTKNILVKNDMSCCLCDMGLAVKITGSRYYTLGEEQHAETKSINDVGTLRYMAPEVLEGAVNLRDCESSLKQIDVYALGLVLWELGTRTAYFYNRPSDVLPYTLPFQHQVGLEPSLEVMQAWICKHKVRVGWPGAWSRGGWARLLKETVEDCTDQDGEARLTALCVHERLSAITVGTPPPQPTSPPHLNHFSPVLEKEIIIKEREITMKDEGLSEGTCETILTISPSDGPPQTHLATFNYSRGIEAAHHGRNPCQERNLLASTESSEELCIVSASCKDSGALERECLIRTPAPRYNHPIPYLQNRPFSTSDSHKLSNSEKNKKPLAVIISKPLKNMIKKKRSTSPNIIIPPLPDKIEVERPSTLELESKPLKEPSARIKTPGDLPPSVRKKRARFSLYDDRMMSTPSDSRQQLTKPFDSSF